MIYISAQPATTYFIWQLELQLRNLSSLGILKDEIQVLLAYNKDLGIDYVFEKFIKENSHLGSFFIYEDQRDKSKYTSSVRPNILKQHFTKFPELEFKTFMYHDSDILFSRIPQIEENDVCYVSDTRHYLDLNYIRSIASEELLDDMLDIVGLDKVKLEKEDNNTGGAQYILTGINSTFWEKVEQDSENLFVVMKNYNTKLWEDHYAQKKEYRSKGGGIQAWCADMWAVLWNLWYLDKKVEIHPEMDFSWPFNPITDWEKLAIQHYSGKINDKDKYFKKGEYVNYSPWYDDALYNIPNTSCSFKIVELIKSRRKELEESRLRFNRTLILLETDAINSETMSMFNIHRNYMQKYFNIDVLLLSNTVDKELERNDEIVFKNTLVERLINYSNYHSFIIIPLTHLIKIDELKLILLNYEININYYSDKQYKVDMLFNEAFAKILEIKLLEDNEGKFNSIEGQKSILKLSTESLKYYLNNQEDKLDLTINNIKVNYILT